MSGLKVIYNPASSRALREKIREFSPDIIHVHNFLPLASPAVFFAAKRMGVPVVLTLHNYRLLCPSATLYHDGKVYEKSLASAFPFDAVWKGVYRNSRMQTAAVAMMTTLHHYLGTWRNKVDCFIALTQFAKEKFASAALSIPANKVTVKSNFVKDCGRGAIQRGKNFLFVGRLVEEKGISTLLKAAASKKFKVTIIGEGPLRSLVEEAAKTNSGINYLGFQPRDIVMKELKKCQALLFPSTWYEGFPVTILESFSTCTPVIASRMGGMKEIVQDGQNGLLFEPENADDLVARIQEFEEDASRASLMRENARLSYLDHYTPGKNYSQLIKIYDRILEQREESTARAMDFAVPALNQLKTA